MTRFLPPPEGYVWVRLHQGSEWQVAYTDGHGSFWITGESEEVDVLEVGPLIERPR